jgi:release factor glutamine methyltransferase
VGHREFFGLEFLVDPRVLIPRPETELLVELALQAGRERTQPIRIADVGTGSGAISVTLAVQLPEAVVYAIDNSADALAVTADNARRHDVADRMHGLLCRSRDPLAPLPEPVDIITANLPYVSTDEWETLAPEIREYEPRSALDGGTDGLEVIRSLLETAGQHLHSRGTVLLEIGASQGAAVMTLARRHIERASVNVVPDYAGLDRVLVVNLPAPPG